MQLFRVCETHFWRDFAEAQAFAGPQYDQHIVIKAEIPKFIQTLPIYHEITFASSLYTDQDRQKLTL